MNPSSTRAQEIRAEASKWSLEGDSKLLEFMREISEKVEKHSRETDLRINRMCLSGDEMNVMLGNTSNRLLALQHSQFVENRVQEDEDVSGEPEKVTEKKQDEQDVRQMSPMTTLKTILGDSVASMNNCYERVNVEFEEDSDDEDEALRSVAFRPIDPYSVRLLPYVIGSKDWKEKWHVGLVDSDSESENEEEPQFSDSGSESTSITLAHNSASQMSSEDERASKISEDASNPVPAQRVYFQPPKLTPRTTLPENPASNLFSSSPPRVPTTSKTPGLFDDLEDDDFDAPPPKDSKAPSIFRDEVRKTVNLFDDEPPEFEVPPPSGQKSQQSGLFLDSDDDDNTFVPPVKPASKEIPNIAKKVEIPTNYLFVDEPPVDDFQSKGVQEASIKTPVNLFDDNDDEFDSFMSSLSASSKKNAPSDKLVQESKPKPKLSNLFDDDDEPDDFFDTLLRGTKKKVKEPQKSEMRVNEVKREVAKEIEKPLEVKKSVNVKKMSLFEDSDDDDIFKTSLKKPEKLSNDIKVSVRARKENIREETSESISEIIPKEPIGVLPEKKPENSYSERRPSGSSQMEVVPPENSFPEEIESQKPETARRTSTTSQSESFDPARKPTVLPRSVSIEEKPQEPETKPENPPKLPDVESSVPSVNLPPPDDTPDTPEDWLKTEPPTFPCPDPPSSPLSSQQNLFNESPEDIEPPPVKKRTTLSGLFDDVVDEGAEDFFSVKPKTLEKDKATNVPLFDDLPPDDDLFMERPERKVISEVFYDDFAESFPPKDSPNTASKASYLFNDEPPDDDWLQQAVKQAAEEKKEVNHVSEISSSSVSSRKSSYSRSSSRDESDEIMSNVRNLIKCHEKQEITPEESVNKSKIVPNKLNKTMAINVAALLPGAKRPSFKNIHENSPEDPEKLTEVIEDEKKEEIPKKSVENVRDDSENPARLTSLNKTRAKITQKRRPSTRRGRQETYRKSMIIESEEDGQEDPQNFIAGDDPSKLPEVLKVSKDTEVVANDLFGVNHTGKETEKKKEIVLKPPKKAKSLFESDDDDDLDIFSSSKKSKSGGSSIIPKSTSEPEKITSKSTSLFGDSDDEDDDLFGAVSMNNSTKVPTPLNKIEKKSIKKAVAGNDPLADLF